APTPTGTAPSEARAAPADCAAAPAAKVGGTEAAAKCAAAEAAAKSAAAEAATKTAAAEPAAEPTTRGRAIRHEQTNAARHRDREHEHRFTHVVLLSNVFCFCGRRCRAGVHSAHWIAKPGIIGTRVTAGGFHRPVRASDFGA